MKMRAAGATAAWAAAHVEVAEDHAATDELKRIRRFLNFPECIPTPFFRTSQILARSA